MTTWSDIFTPRQLVALTTLCDLIKLVKDKVVGDAIEAGLSDDHVPLSSGGKGAQAYGEAICVYLGLTIGRQVNRTSSLCFWDSMA